MVHELLQGTAAVKIPRKGDLDSEEADQFLREARAAAQLPHPNIVGVHEVGREEDAVYIFRPSDRLSVLPRQQAPGRGDR